MPTIDQIININITRQTSAPTQAGFGTMLFATDTVPGGFTERVRTYTSAQALVDDGFATTDDAYLAAVAYFSQQISPTQIKIGREDVGDADIAATISAISAEDDDWYALTIYDKTPATITLAATTIEATKKIFGYSTEEADALAVTTTDTYAVNSAANLDRTLGLWNEGDENFPEAAWFGRMLPTTPGSATWAYKTLSGVTASNLTATEEVNLGGKNANWYQELAGISHTTGGDPKMGGIMASGEFIDVIRGIDKLSARIQERILFQLVNLPKIPFTNSGVSVVTNEISAELNTSIAEGLLTADPLPQVNAPLVSEISVLDKANRCLPDVTFQATLAGAVHKVAIQGTVSV
jgi:hypothetical protein